MKAIDLFKIAWDGKGLLDAKAAEFMDGLAKTAGTGRLVLTDKQHAYLQACYDRVVSRKYGVEPMATDREWAARRAIGKSRRER